MKNKNINARVADSTKKKNLPFEDAIYKFVFEETRDPIKNPKPDDAIESVEYVLSKLDERAKTIVVMYAADCKTMAEIAAEFGISGSRIGQILHHSKRRMKHPVMAEIILNGLSIYREKELDKQEKRQKQVEDTFNLYDLDLPIEHLFISGRAYNALKRANANTVGDIKVLIEKGELLKVTNIGRVTYMEIINKLNLPV